MGDLIIALDNVDTRMYTAKQPMRVMAFKSELERKITVLHYEEEWLKMKMGEGGDIFFHSYTCTSEKGEVFYYIYKYKFSEKN